MIHFFIPLIPLTLAGALYFKRNHLAYGFPILLVLVRGLFTQLSWVEIFTISSLLLSVYGVRALKPAQSLPVWNIAGLAFFTILGYELFSNFGVWALGGCTGEETPLYPYSLAGLWQCYRAALPYAAVHFLRDIPLSVAVVKAFEFVARIQPVRHVARENA